MLPFGVLTPFCVASLYREIRAENLKWRGVGRQFGLPEDLGVTERFLVVAIRGGVLLASRSQVMPLNTLQYTEQPPPPPTNHHRAPNISSVTVGELN